MSGRYCKLTSSCVSFTIYQQCHGDIVRDVTPISLQYQNVHWEKTTVNLHFVLSLYSIGKKTDTVKAALFVIMKKTPFTSKTLQATVLDKIFGTK